MKKQPETIEGLYTVAPSGCWLWRGWLSPKGYAQIRRGGRRYWAHRYSWQLIHGPIPPGLTIDHLCFVPACVNPEHLRLLSHEENSRNQRVVLRLECSHGHRRSPETTYFEKRGKADPRLRIRCSVCLKERKARAKQRAALPQLEGLAA